MPIVSCAASLCIARARVGPHDADGLQVDRSRAEGWLFGYEEAIGFLNAIARDKDGIASSVVATSPRSRPRRAWDELDRRGSRPWLHVTGRDLPVEVNRDWYGTPAPACSELAGSPVVRSLTCRGDLPGPAAHGRRAGARRRQGTV